MKFVIEHLSKVLRKRKFSEILILPLMKEKFMDCSAETVRAKQRCLIV